MQPDAGPDPDWTRFVVIAVPAAGFVSLVAALVVHARAGDETFRCADGPCALGSGGSWFLTGVAVFAPIVAVAGFAWTRHLHLADRLGPFSYRRIPDGEEILEGLAVLLAGLVSWWLLRNGPRIVAIDVGFPNNQLLGRLGRRPLGQPYVPTRFTWFFVGALLSAPFAFSMGSMIGREWYGRNRRRSFDRDLETLAAGSGESEAEAGDEADD